MSYSKREKALAFWTLLIVGLGLIYTTGVSPAWKRYTQLTAEQADVDNDVKALEEQNRVNKQYRQRWKTLKGRLASADADQFYKNFQANLRKKGVTQKSHSKGYGEKLKRVDARRVPYQFNLECNLQSLANLLASMDNMKDFLRAENVSITPQKSGRFQVSMSVSTLVAETGEKK